MVQWCNGSMVQWFNGAMVQWFNGAMVQWFNGAMVQWFNGSMVQWCNGRVVCRTTKSYINHVAVLFKSGRDGKILFDGGACLPAVRAGRFIFWASLILWIKELS